MKSDKTGRRGQEKKAEFLKMHQKACASSFDYPFASIIPFNFSPRSHPALKIVDLLLSMMACQKGHILVIHGICPCFLQPQQQQNLHCVYLH